MVKTIVGKKEVGTNFSHYKKVGLKIKRICNEDDVISKLDCLDFNQLYFNTLFPHSVHNVDLYELISMACRTRYWAWLAEPLIKSSACMVHSFQTEKVSPKLAHRAFDHDCFVVRFRWHLQNTKMYKLGGISDQSYCTKWKLISNLWDR